MNNRPRRSTRYYRRGRRLGAGRRRPALLGTTAIVSVLMLALGGVLLVGLDTVGAQGKQLARVVQPEVAQAPQVSEETDSGGASDRKDDSESEKSDNSENEEEGSGGKQEKKEQEEQASNQESDGNQGGEQAQKSRQQDQQQSQEPPDPPAPSDPTMGMTIPRLDMYGDTVWNSGSLETMHQGAIKLPPTGFPWQDNANTYISAHRIGFPGTQSYNQFYNLPAMQQNDAVYLTDANGTTYEYRVTDKFAVKPWENWVTEPQPGGDMVTLQTCVDSLDPSTWWDITPALFEAGPDTARLVVQAEKVDTIPAG